MRSIDFMTNDENTRCKFAPALALLLEFVAMVLVSDPDTFKSFAFGALLCRCCHGARCRTV